MLTVPRISTALATVVIETFFYGIYVILFFASIYLLLTVKSRGFRREGSIWRSPILCGGTVLFIAVTALDLTVNRLFLAFVDVNGGTNPLTFYSDFSQVTEVVQSSFLLASLAIVDALFCSMGLNLTETSAGSSIGVTYDFSRFQPGDSIPELASQWIIADCVFTVLLWRVQNVLKPSGGRTLMSVLVIIVESAALSATWAIFFITAYGVKSNLRFLIDVTPAIVANANTLIYVRVGLGWAHAPAAASATPIRFKTAQSTTRDSMDFQDWRTEGAKSRAALV
ncbi:hypothetical protein B0H10DRAFT_1950061 [Mycena sp. CBHHK59/15]|nr:hypothetical protein B0H10DRAFT_1950061 [Mycena sp. CBHHK59/15]